MPEPILVILLGQLAVDRNYQGKGLGTDLLIDAGKRALAAAEVIGARAIIVQALDEQAKAFYGRSGFLQFSAREPHMSVVAHIGTTRHISRLTCLVFASMCKIQINNKTLEAHRR